MVLKLGLHPKTCQVKSAFGQLGRVIFHFNRPNAVTDGLFGQHTGRRLDFN
jgi:hypothetical protein